ncbi:recombinase RecT [Levilactobacillus spicheri]|uniref:DNA recombination protein RecT n=1 Tax=Levilactobacillus spicheri TaxID=216463 RepID=A0ABQ0WTE3_9LACO|nr:RecT family recombinase [Levilactobacillus spicheri]GEO68009.1 DNA recombination protein RecT [Levilactobacillus spicheri]
MANELVVSVQNEINNMQKNEGLKLPPSYSVGNALNAAWLILSDDSKGPSMLEKCDPRSVSKALLNMAIQGLSPAKNQCYFIPYGKQCTLQRSYFGSVTVLKQLSSVKDIKAQAVFKGDGFEIGADDEMNLIVTKYQPKFENRDNPIIGAFAYVLQEDGHKVWTVMTKKEIDASWSQSRTHNVQQKFGQEMAQRTIINRAAKLYINSSTDNDLFVKAINDSTEAEYDDDQPAKDVTPKKTVADLIEPGTAKDTSETSEAPQKSESASESVASESVSEQSASAESLTDSETANSLIKDIDKKEDDSDADGTERTDLFNNGVHSKFD